MTGLFLPQGAPAVAYGPRALDRLGEICDALGASRVLVVTTRSLADERALLADVTGRLAHRWAATFAGSRQHTPDMAVEAGRRAFVEHDADAVVSVGGGSAIDTAKGIVLCAALGNDLSPYFATVSRAGGAARLRRGSLHERLAAVDRRGGPSATGTGPRALAPHVAVPTTLSGAEYTDHAGITTAASGRKEQVYHPDLVPAVVVLDPAATGATPAPLWLSTGVKVLDHVVEILCSPGTSSPSEALCLGALRRVVSHLRASADPAATVARAEMQVAAWLAVAGYPNQAAGISHAAGHQLGGYCNVPHGFAACCILPRAMRFNCLAAADAFARMAETMGLAARGPDAADRVIAAVEDLVDGLGLPRRLRDVGVHLETLPHVAELTLADAAIAGNPRPVRDAAEILDEVLVPAW